MWQHTTGACKKSIDLLVGSGCVLLVVALLSGYCDYCLIGYFTVLML